jgi:hypothetical protein
MCVAQRVDTVSAAWHTLDVSIACWWPDLKSARTSTAKNYLSTFEYIGQSLNGTERWDGGRAQRTEEGARKCSGPPAALVHVPARLALPALKRRTKHATINIPPWGRPTHRKATARSTWRSRHCSKPVRESSQSHSRSSLRLEGTLSHRRDSATTLATGGHVQRYYRGTVHGGGPDGSGGGRAGEGVVHVGEVEVDQRERALTLEAGHCHTMVQQRLGGGGGLTSAKVQRTRHCGRPTPATKQPRLLPCGRAEEAQAQCQTDPLLRTP